MQELYEVASYNVKDTEALIPSTDIYSGYLVGGVEQILAVPTDAQIVVFSFDNNIYVNYDNTATVPTGTISQAGGELNPKARYIGSTTNIHLIAQAGTHITLSFYKK